MFNTFYRAVYTKFQHMSVVCCRGDARTRSLYGIYMNVSIEMHEFQPYREKSIGVRNTQTHTMHI